MKNFEQHFCLELVGQSIEKMSSNTKPSYEFDYYIKMVKTYYDTATFTREDVDSHFEGHKIEITDPEKSLLRPDGTVVPEEEMGYIIRITYDDLTEEEKDAFHKCVSEVYSPSDQQDAEARDCGYEYDGEIDEDERYDEGTPETVTDEWDNCWREWLNERGGTEMIWKRLAPPPAPPKPKIPEEVKEICRKHYIWQIKEAEEMIACLQRNLQKFKDHLKALDA